MLPLGLLTCEGLRYVYLRDLPMANTSPGTQDQRPAWMAQTNSNANDSRVSGRTETATHVYRHENNFD